MFSKYNDTFDLLVESYFNGNFDDTFIRALAAHEKSPQETFAVLSSLCGSNIPYDNNYLNNIKTSIENYNPKQKIVEKIKGCDTTCEKATNGSSPCQDSCPNNAISYDTLKGEVYIDDMLCNDCGICISACKHGTILDKVEVLPLINRIKSNDNVIIALDPNIISCFHNHNSLVNLKNSLYNLGFKNIFQCSYDELLSKKSNKDTVVFVGSSIDKKANLTQSPYNTKVDFVLTYDELEEVLHAMNM